MHRPLPSDNTPATPPGANGFATPAPNGQFAPNPFAVATPTAPPPAAVRSLPNIPELLSAFKRRWPLALMIGAVVATLMAAGVWLALPSGKHQVRALVQFKMAPANLLANQSDMSMEQFKRQMDNHGTYMKTKNFLDKVASDPEVRGLPMISAVPAEERANVIRGMFTFKPENDEIVSVSLNGDEPEAMQTILRVMVREYLDKDRDEGKNERAEKLKKLEESLKAVDEDIAAKQKELQQRLGGATDPLVPQLIAGRIQTHQQNLRKAETDAQDLKNRLQTLDERIAQGDFTPDPEDVQREYAGSAAVNEKLADLAAARLKLEKIRKTVREGDPAVADAQARVMLAEKAVADAQGGVASSKAEELKGLQKGRMLKQRAALVENLQVARRNAEDSKAELEKLQQENKAARGDTVDINLAQKALEPLTNKRQQLSQQKVDLESQERNATARIVVLEEPQIYRNLNLKTKSAFAGVAAIAGLLAVCLLVCYLEWRNRRVDGVDQVVAELGMRVIGTIPAFPSRAALRSGEAGANQNWRFILNESVNSTRTMLLHTARTQQMQVLLVTSAMQGEGKTSLSSQLATSMATAGLRTLILDCDLRNPSMQKLFDVPVAPGCAEILLQEIDISDAIQQTSVPNLWIIPAGQCNHRVIAALAQGHPIEALLNRVRGQFDIIIVDSCPILPVADTLLVAQHVDGVVFSILQDVSQLPKVHDASERLTQLNIPLLGAVVNGIKPDIQAYGYNYVKQLPA
ncbi:MAG: polysaccharide biosynthesis tyrosine autokinase [Fimbriiglobus sp.]|jgi:capsular exopolysaccharide synthesis family protein|nr:polysaccharide biosynthesis tyrosine autokinase [Fimbriiglobus sp.]